eukprot:17095-Eustigmatos_ZCMA.PRE.1
MLEQDLHCDWRTSHGAPPHGSEIDINEASQIEHRPLPGECALMRADAGVRVAVCDDGDDDDED